MNKMSLISALGKLYADNFVLYYKSHVYHFNVEGATFAQDHGLLEELYTFLWESHDTIGELIRQEDKLVTVTLKSVLEITSLNEAKSTKISSAVMFGDLITDIQDVLDCAQYVYDTAENEGCGGTSTAVGDYLKALSKINWKLKATLGKSVK